MYQICDKQDRRDFAFDHKVHPRSIWSVHQRVTGLIIGAFGGAFLPIRTYAFKPLLVFKLNGVVCRQRR